MASRPCRIASLALVLCLSASVHAGQDKTDDFVNAEMARQRIPGLSLAILEDGRIVKAQGSGVADRDRRIAATPYVDNDRLLVAPEWPALRPSGAFISTVLDLAKWDWQLAPRNGHPRVYHTGGMQGARAAFVKCADQRLTMTALMNLDDVDIESIIGGLAALHLPPR